MIEVTVYRNQGRKPVGVRLFGHAGYAERGKDIVCAAVSILVINTLNAIENFTDDQLDCDMDEKVGCIDFKIVSEVSEGGELLLNALLLGLESIQKTYGHGYLQIKDMVL